jgi:hypothetical protein
LRKAHPAKAGAAKPRVLALLRAAGILDATKDPKTAEPPTGSWAFVFFRSATGYRKLALAQLASA